MRRLLTYRKGRGDIFWHFFTDCQGWPRGGNYDEVTTNHPPIGGYCRLCRERHIEEFRARWNRPFSTSSKDRSPSNESPPPLFPITGSKCQKRFMIEDEIAERATLFPSRLTY